MTAARTALWCAAAVGVGAWMIACGCDHAGHSPRRQRGKETTPASQSAMSLNADCCMCHQPFLSEPLSAQHAEEGVACVDCHGKSVAHTTDERFEVPPDRVFAPKEVEPFCLECHKRHDIKPAMLETEAAKAGADDGPVRCTTCHGQHRISMAALDP